MAMLRHVGSRRSALAEAIRVLRPGGRLLGYDLLDHPALRMIHLDAAADTTLLRRGQLETALRGLPVTDVRIRHTLTGLAVRFSATKTRLSPDVVGVGAAARVRRRPAVPLPSKKGASGTGN